jgi:hypothetical protein
VAVPHLSIRDGLSNIDALPVFLVIAAFMGIVDLDTHKVYDSIGDGANVSMPRTTETTPMNAICPRCLDAAAEVTLNVADGATLTCASCNEEFTVSDVRALVDGWAKLLPWLEAHPARTPAAELRVAAAG